MERVLNYQGVPATIEGESTRNCGCRLAFEKPNRAHRVRTAPTADRPSVQGASPYLMLLQRI